MSTLTNTLLFLICISAVISCNTEIPEGEDMKIEDVDNSPTLEERLVGNWKNETACEGWHVAFSMNVAFENDLIQFSNLTFTDVEDFELEIIDDNQFHASSHYYGCTPTQLCSITGTLINDNLIEVTLRTFTVAASGTNQHSEYWYCDLIRQ